MIHRLSTTRNDPSAVEIPGKEKVEAKEGYKPRGNACLRCKVLLRRHRRVFFLVLFLCMTCYIRYLMDAMPRIIRRRQFRLNPLIVPFSIEGDSLLSRLGDVIVKNVTLVHKEKAKAQWRWYCYSSEQQSPISFPRVLLAQYSEPAGPDAHYSLLLKWSSKVNMAYAQNWGIDYVILRGIALDDCHAIPSKYFQTRHSSFNKLELLQHALTLTSQYDWIWILDADALLKNFTLSPLSILPPGNSTFLMAHRVQPNDTLHTHNINNGVTFWNLHHPQTNQVLASWKRKSLNRISVNAQLKERGFSSSLSVEHGDQEILHSVLMDMSQEDRKGVYATPNLQLDIITHVVRGNFSQWVPGADQGRDRQNFVKAAAHDVCRRNSPACNGIVRNDYFEGNGDGILEQPFHTTGCPDPGTKI